MNSRRRSSVSLENLLRSQQELPTREDVRDALDAIVRCNAIDSAYEVAAAAGWGELFPGCVYQNEEENQMALDVTTARSIMKQAIKDETYSGAEPEDDATCIKEAESLVDMAEQAWAQYIRGPDVEVILKLANSASQNGDAPEGEPTPEEDAPMSEGPGDPSEKENAITNQETDEESETAPEVDLEALDPELTTVEPWEGYNEERVKDIAEALSLAQKEYDTDDQMALISNVWSYELAHKRRARVLKLTSEMWKQLTGGEIGPQKSESESGGDAEAQADAETPPVEQDGQARSGSDGDDAQAEGTTAEADDATADTEPTPSEPTSKAGEKKSEPAEKSSRASGAKGSGSGEEPLANAAYRALIEGVERELEGERLHVPKAPPEEAPDLPWRWADISDADLHDFHMQYAALAYYKQYIATREERIAQHCREAADELHNALLLQLDKYDEKGKQKTVTLLDAEIESDPNVRSWRKRQRKHEQFAQAAKRELDSYHKQVEALSRLETMRHNSWERARR